MKHVHIAMVRNTPDGRGPYTETMAKRSPEGTLGICYPCEWDESMIRFVDWEPTGGIENYLKERGGWVFKIQDIEIIDWDELFPDL